MIEYISLLNNNKIVGGLCMLLLNVGSRYVVADLGKFHEAILTNDIFKKIILFAMFFVATRDILIAFLLSILYIVIIDGLLHEKRKFCIIPNKYKEQLQNSNKVDEKQYLEAKQKIMIFEQQKQNNSNPQTQKNDNYSSYMYNINYLNK